MPFLAAPAAAPAASAAAPWITAGVTSGIGLLGSLLGGKMAGPNRAQREMSELQAGLARKTAPVGASMYQLAGRSMNPVVDYWSKILSGDRGQATSMMAPELNRISEGYGANTRAAEALMPRGGGRATVMQQLPYQQLRDQTTLMQTARPQAATNLLQAGSQAGALGSSALWGATSAGRDALSFQHQQREYEDKQGEWFGNLLRTATKDVDWAKLLGAGGGAKPPIPGLPPTPAGLPGMQAGLGNRQIPIMPPVRMGRTPWDQSEPEPGFGHMMW